MVKSQAIEKFSILSRQSEVRLFGSQQRERLEHLFAAGVGGQATFGDAYKANAFRQADKAYLEIVGNESIKLTDATILGLAKYKEVLDSYNVNPLESRRPNLLGALDFLKAEASRSGGLSTPDKTALRSLMQNGEQPQILARMLWAGDNNLDKPNTRLAYFDSAANEGNIIAWSSRPEGLGGSGLDYQETMRRFGWTSEQIADAKASDFKFAVFTADAAVDLESPTHQVITERAKGDDKVFGKFAKEPESFWQEVDSYDYEGKLNEAKTRGFDRTNIDGFIADLPPKEARVFEARQQQEKRMGVNPLSTGDGMTKRPDGINGRIGVPEHITDNTAGDATLREMAKKGQLAFVDMQDLGLLDDFKQQLAEHRATIGDSKATLPLPEIPVRTTSEAARLPRITEGAILKSEMRGGAKAGAAFGAVMSLREVYDQSQRGDYTGAATTLAVNTGGGATLGALSSGGERIVGRGLENILSRSNLASQGLERLYANGAARNLASRLAGTEASNISSQAFNSTLRTVAGRVGGAGVVGGVVSGAFSAYDQIGAYRRNEVSASQAIGTVTGGIGFINFSSKQETFSGNCR